MRIENGVITFDVLKVSAQSGVIGESEPMKVAAPKPSHFSNAEGGLRLVESLEEIHQAAEASGKAFREAIR